MSDLSPHSRDDLVELPADCELPAPLTIRRDSTEAPAVADVGHLPRRLYTIDSNRSRFQIIATYAREHNLTVAQIDELVRQLPDYGIKSMLHASLVATIRCSNIVDLAQARAERRMR